jgi:hypothetical protein
MTADIKVCPLCQKECPPFAAKCTCGYVFPVAQPVSVQPAPPTLTNPYRLPDPFFIPFEDLLPKSPNQKK